MRLRAYILSFILPIFGYGQVTLLSETDTKEYQVREPFNLSIGLEIIGENYQQQSPVRLPDLSKFEILGNATESVAAIDPETGNVVRQVLYHLILQPKQAGKTRIGSALVQVNGKTYKSEPFEILVRDGKRKNEAWGRSVSMVMEVLDKEVYENQPVNVVLKLKANPHNYLDFRKVNQIKLPQKTKNIYTVNLKREDIEIDKNDETAMQVIASFVVVPEKDGNLFVAPATALFNEERILSNPLKIHVKKLPEGAPRGFKNAVGKFDLEVEIPKEEVEVNQPMDVFVKLKGKGNIIGAELPKIVESDDYTILKPTQKIDVKESELSGEKTDHYVIIPKKEGEITIRYEDFAYFDIGEKQYQTINSDDIKILSLSKEDMDSPKSTLGKMMDDTGHILKKVNLLPVSEEEKEEESFDFGRFAGIGLLVFGSLLAIYFFTFRKKKPKQWSSVQEDDKITTIAETEELLKENISIGKEYYFGALKNAAYKGDSASFFENYQELHTEAENQIKRLKNQTISEFLEEIENADFVKDFEQFRTEIQEAKYAPVHEGLYEFYNDIVKFYTKIME
ncbi:MAG: BatD family protein [Flavobacteriaceae bacterium]|nr:BatD family protein [Flavobacteriaceae bacterium]